MGDSWGMAGFEDLHPGFSDFYHPYVMMYVAFVSSIYINSHYINSECTYIYIYIHVRVCVCIDVYIYI